MCPWREPDADLRAFFPAATRYQTETRILSGQRLELQRRLERVPTAQENSIYVHRIFRDNLPLGSVVTRRVKGENGAIEIVLALDTSGAVSGLRLQRLREPKPVAEALANPVWLGAFGGKTAESAPIIGKDLPELIREAQPSARSIIEGVRSLLVLMAVSEGRPNLANHH